MTDQEIFDKVAKHLLTQKAVSKDEEGCVYRGENGLKCAIGVLIPDDVYTSSLEGNTILSVRNLYPEIIEKSGLATVNMYLLDALQTTHDAWDVRSWKVVLKKVAKDFNLDYSVLK